MGQSATVYDERGLAELVRSARKQLGWTQADLAARANVSTRVVEKLEGGEGKTVNLRTVFALLRALSIDFTLTVRKGGAISLEEVG